MKRYVIEFANDMIRQDRENDLMRPDIRDRRRGHIEAVLEDYRFGLISACEAVAQIAKA